MIWKISPASITGSAPGCPRIEEYETLKSSEKVSQLLLFFFVVITLIDTSISDFLRNSFPFSSELHKETWQQSHPSETSPFSRSRQRGGAKQSRPKTMIII